MLCALCRVSGCWFSLYASRIDAFYLVCGFYQVWTRKTIVGRLWHPQGGGQASACGVIAGLGSWVGVGWGSGQAAGSARQRRPTNAQVTRVAWRDARTREGSA